MTCTWNKNLSENTRNLKERFPELYKLLEPKIESAKTLLLKAETTFNDPDSLEILNSVFPFWEFIKARDGSVSAKENGVLIHSGYSPVKEVQKLFSEKSDSDATWIFAGFGLGYAPLEFSKINNDNLLVIIEPDPGFLFASWCCLDWTDIFNHEKCIIITDTAAENILPLLESLNALDSAKIITQNSQTRHQEHWFKTFFTLFERNKQKQNINENTLKRFSSLWLKNSTRNLKFFSESSGINIYKNMLENNIPSVVCAAGPTLENILPHLNELKKRAVVICVDTALRALLRAGVEPDFILLIDPQYYAACHISDLDSPSSVLITESSVYPSVLRFNSRKTVFCESLFPLGQYFEKKLLADHSLGKITAGGSVSTSAWDFAKFIGSREIYMAGLDLGYPDNITHIKGSTFEEKSHTASYKLKPAENNLCSILFSAANENALSFENNKIITDSKMKLFAWWFESQIAKNPQLKTYSLSSKSLNIPGMTVCDISRLLSFSDISREKQAAFISAENKKNSFDREEFESALNELKFLLEELYELARKGQNLCQKILDQSPVTASQMAEQHLKELEKIDSKILNSKAKDVASLVFPTKSQLAAISAEQKQYQIPILNAIAQSRTIYQQLVKAIKQYQMYL